MAKGKKQYKYQVVKEQKQPNLHMLYLIRYKASNGGVSEKWVGQSQLRRYYQQDKLTGQFSEHVTRVLTAEPVKPKPKGKKPLTPRMEGDGPVYSNLKDMDFSEQKVEPVSNWAKPVSELLGAPKWNLKDFEVEQAPVATGRAYIITRADGRCCVVLPDGSLDDEWTPLMHAEIYRDSLNKEVDENKS